MKYTKNQSLDLSVTVILDNGLLLANALTHIVQVRLPDGTIDDYPATIVGDTLEISIAKDVLIDLGIHSYWALLTFEGNYKYYGTAGKFQIVEPWENIIS